MLDLPQPSANYDPARERVRNSRIRLEIEKRMTIEQFGYFLRLDPDWPFGGGVVVGMDGGDANDTYVDGADGGNALWP